MLLNSANSRINTKSFLLLIIATVLFSLAYTHRVIPTIIAPDLLKEFSVSASMLGFMISGYFYGYIISQPLVGVFADRVSPRRVLSIFAGIATAGVIIFALSPTALWMLADRLLIGFGSGGVWMPDLKIISLFFKPRRYASLTGILGAGGLRGGIVATALYAVLVEVLA